MRNLGEPVRSVARSTPVGVCTRRESQPEARSGARPWACALRVSLLLSLLGLCGLALYPVADGWRGADAQPAPPSGSTHLALELVTGLRCAPTLQGWGNIGGCGAGGGSASGGTGAKWIGRGVSGGYVDLQLLASQAYSHDNYFSTFNTRIGTGVLPKWNFGVNVPILYKAGQVDVLGQSSTANIAGFGDVSVEVTRKLGITNASLLTLIVNAPTGAHDAVREGIVLPQHLQLGSGVLGVSAQFEHTLDRDWGLMIFGGTAGYNGWENSIDDWRAPTATAYGHVGYIRGPLVPAAGLTLFAKPLHDRERGDDRLDDNDPLFMVVPSLSLEWSVDWLALLLYANASLSYNGFESVSVSLGFSTSLF